MSTPIPNTGTKTLLNRTFFNRFVVQIAHCASGFQRITRKDEYHHDYFSVFSFAPFDPQTEMYDERYRLFALIFFRFYVVWGDLKKQRF